MKLLVVEDNERLSDRIQQHLRPHHVIDVAITGHDALERASKFEYDLIILDLGLPDMSGLEVCRQIRADDKGVPILVLTGNDETESRVTLLDNGADDYLTKPFNKEELRARISALGRRRARTPATPKLYHQDLVIDSAQRRVTRAGQEVKLRRKEFDILEYLVANTGRILTREMILHHAWDGDKVTWKSTVDVHVKHLRDKIDRPFKTPLVKTAYGLGYWVENPEDVTKERNPHHE